MPDLISLPRTPMRGHPEHLVSTGFPFDFAQGGEFFNVAQDREPVERLVEPFEICILVLEIFMIFIKLSTLFIKGNFLFK
jgi:hypothetical protein